MDHMRVCVILPAAGKSTRFGSDKLGQDLGGRPLLLRTVEPFTRRDEVRSIIVAAPPDSIDDFRNRFGAQLGFHGVRIIPGGVAERWETVRNALAEVPDDCTHVAIHDAARPGASDELLQRVFEAALVSDAVVPGIPVADTLKRVTTERFSSAPFDDAAEAILGEAGRDRATAPAVEATIARERLFAVQTPQVFAVALLRRAYAAPDLSGVTDDSMLVERLGERVLVVEGETRNLKITTPEDLDLIRQVLGFRPPTERPVHKRF